MITNSITAAIFQHNSDHLPDPETIPLACYMRGKYDPHVYDVVIYEHGKRPEMPGRTLKWEITLYRYAPPFRAKRKIGYFYKKFEPRQVVIAGHPIRRCESLFTNIYHDIKWIQSILQVEFDYHYGYRECESPGNRIYLEAYLADSHSGYGPGFLKK